MVHIKIKKLIIFVLSIYLAGNNITCYAASYNTSKQERALTTAVNKNPGSTETSLKLIKHYLDNDQDTKAMIELNRIQGRVSNNSKFFILAANLFMKRGLLDEAEKAAKNAVKVSYNNPNAFIILGNVYFEKAISLENTQENFELRKNYLIKSFDNFYTAYKYNPASPFAHIGLANAYYMNGQTALAKDEILKANELSVNNAEALYLIGAYYYKTKEYEKAKTFLENSMSAGLKTRYKTYYMLGTLYEQEGAVEKAQQNYLSSLKIKPDFSEAQKNLDRLIKITYKEVETLSNKQKRTADLFNNLNEELNTVMQADYFLAIDEFTKARDGYMKVLDKSPDNINAVTGLAELYYAKWSEGFANSADFINDSKYILKTKENPRIAISLTKFKLINEDLMPENVRQKLINLSVSETFDFYDLLNEVRAEFLLGNFEQSHEKLEKLLNFKLSNYEKFKVLKSLCYDHNYGESLVLIEELKKTYYHNEEIAPIENRIKTKLKVADEKLDQAIALYNNKDSKQNNYSGAEEIIIQAVRYFPTYQKVYLHYAYLLEKQKRYKEAYEKAVVCQKLNKLYPSKNIELNDEEIKKFVQNLNKKLVESK